MKVSEHDGTIQAVRCGYIRFDESMGSKKSSVKPASFMQYRGAANGVECFPMRMSYEAPLRVDRRLLCGREPG